MRTFTGILAAVVIGVCASASGMTYYVDAENGNDNWDGSVDFAHRVGMQGPRKTLVSVMELATQTGDIVYAAEGDYDEGADVFPNTHASSNRVTVAAGVSLIASGAVERTTIWGAESPNPVRSDKWKYGPNAVRCVYLKANATIRGFTLRNGCTDNGTSGYGQDSNCSGGGVLAANKDNCRIVDCVIRDCCGYCGSAGYGGIYINCTLIDSRGFGAYGGVGNCWLYGCYVNNVVADWVVFDCEKRIYNCTFGPIIDKKIKTAWGGDIPIYNSVFVCKASGIEGFTLYNCAIGPDAKTYAKIDPTTCRTFDTLEEMELDSTDRYRPLAGSPIRDMGRNDIFSNADLAKAVPVEYRSHDIAGSARLRNVTVDAGCFEYAWTNEFSLALAEKRVAVTNVSAGVTLATDGGLSVPTGSVINVAWTAPLAGTVTYRLDVAVAGSDAVLKMYLDAEEAPFATVTPDDGKMTISYEHAVPEHALTVVCTGSDGAAVIGNFVDSFYANIAADLGGMEVSGDLKEPGSYLLVQPTTFTIRRTLMSERLSTGFTTNGVYVSWDSYPNGFTWTVDSRETSIDIAAVYADHYTLYVDAVNGSDANTGFLTNHAFKTLVHAVTNRVLGAEDVIVALPGVYDQGEMIVPGSSHAISNRVCVPANVRLCSRDGAAVTIIKGKESPVPTLDKWKLGPQAVRCVYLAAGASVEGFTLEGGRTGYDGGTSSPDVFGAGIYATDTSWVVDCVVTNCYGGTQGAMTENGSAVRTRFVECGGEKAYTGLYRCSLYNCYLNWFRGNYSTYWPKDVVNCTFGPDGKGPQVTTCWNSIIVAQVGASCAFHRCAIAQERVTTANGETYDADCITNLTLAALHLDATNEYCPLAGSAVIDTGSPEYLEKIPERFRTSAYPGGSRIYNGCVDIGAREYDWRGTYARDVDRRLSVTEASPTVVETPASNVRLDDGARLVFVWETGARLSNRRFNFTVSGGTLTIRRNGDVVAALDASGEWTYLQPIVDDRLELSFVAAEDGGYADVLRTNGADGLLLILR